MQYLSRRAVPLKAIYSPGWHVLNFVQLLALITSENVPFGHLSQLRSYFSLYTAFFDFMVPGGQDGI